MLRILIVEDDDELRESLVLALIRVGHLVSEAGSAKAARPLLADVDLLLTDLRLPDDLGTTLLVEAQRVNPQIQIILMTGYGTVESAIAATRNGARDYLLKPFDMDVLKRQVDEVDKLLGLRKDVASAGDGLIGVSLKMRRVFAAIDVAAATSAPVLIEGETGTGKELAARAIHQRSIRRKEPLICVNLAALPMELVDSELFGHERGSFTSAQQKRQGRFSLAGSGTLFLDEINSMPLELQPKLLRALETREIWPVGAEQPQRMNAQIIAASNEPLATLVDQGRFRADLFYRLDVLRVDMPPLRERQEDIPLIARVLIDQREAARSVKVPIEISASAMNFLQTQPWPGNVRELKNLIERTLLRSAALTRKPPRLELQDFEQIPEEQPVLPFKEAQSAATDAWTRTAIVNALRQANGNRAQAAKLLQMNRTALFKLMRKLDIE